MNRMVVGIMLWSSLWRTGKELHLLIVISHWALINRSIQGFWLDRFIHLYYWQMDLKILQYWSHEVIFLWKTEYSQDRNRYIVPWVIGVQNCNGVASWSNSGPLMWNINFPKQPYHMYNIQTYKCSVMMFGMINKLIPSRKELKTLRETTGSPRLSNTNFFAC